MKNTILVTESLDVMCLVNYGYPGDSNLSQSGFMLTQHLKQKRLVGTPSGADADKMTIK